MMLSNVGQLKLIPWRKKKVVEEYKKNLQITLCNMNIRILLLIKGLNNLFFVLQNGYL